MLLAALERRPEPLVVMRRRQPDVYDCDVGREAPHLEQKVVGVLALSDDLEPALAEQACESLAQKHAVLGDRYTHGISALTRVPPPSGVHTCSRPPSASTRSASPRRPEPRSVSAPPTPSSTTSTTTCPFVRTIAAVALVACACLPMFVRLSETT